MKNKIRIFIFIIAAFSFHFLCAQEKDMQTWITLEIKAPVMSKFEFSLENELRFVNNTSLFGRNQTELELFYNQNSNLSFGLGYRLAFDYPFSDYSEHSHRWLADILWKTRIQRLRINTRFRLQNDQEFFQNEGSGNLIHREKIRLAYKIRNTPFLIYTGVETYFRISNTPFELRKVRLSAGTRMDISDNSQISVDLIRDREYNRTNPLTAFILQLGYSFEFGKPQED